MSSGQLYRIDQTGSGAVDLYRLTDRTYVLRLEEFFVTANTDLEVKLSGLEAPLTSGQFIEAPSALVAPLEVTTGSLNFIVSVDVDPTRFKSVVVTTGSSSLAWSPTGR